MTSDINCAVYQRIKTKVLDGTFKKGQKCSLVKKYYSNKTIKDFPVEKRTPEVCTSLMSYNRCSFKDVPESSRTRSFYIENFTNKDVYEYIKNNIQAYDKSFFKDLIETNSYSLSFENNCFEIMPISYINEEMCSLAILKSLNWSDNKWFYSVVKRKPEALSADLWKLGARLYSRLNNNENKFLNVTPSKYQDQEYFKEMCSCNYNNGIELVDHKGRIMNSIPDEIITPEFVLILIKENINNIANFNEKAFELEITHQVKGKLVKETIWQFLIRLKGVTIRYIPLNEDRIAYFLEHYSLDSFEYNYAFKEQYAKYRLEHKKNQKSSEFTYLLPIKYLGVVPSELYQKLDADKYLLLIYKRLGIKILGRKNNLFYKVELPSGWTIENMGSWYYLLDQKHNCILEFYKTDKDSSVQIIKTIPSLTLKKKKD